MLKILFEWLDQNPSAYAIMVAGPTLLVLAWALIPAIRSLRDNTPKPASDDSGDDDSSDKRPEHH